VYPSGHTQIPSVEAVHTSFVTLQVPLANHGRPVPVGMLHALSTFPNTVAERKSKAIFNVFIINTLFITSTTKYIKTHKKA
jgi:hypothetical protein